MRVRTYTSSLFSNLQQKCLLPHPYHVLTVFCDAVIICPLESWLPGTDLAQSESNKNSLLKNHCSYLCRILKCLRSCSVVIF